jgi:hypothetical protein
LVNTQDVWWLLWKNVFEWLPWPLFAFEQFDELTYYGARCPDPVVSLK